MENKFFIKVKESLTKEQIEQFKFDLKNSPLIVTEPMEVIKLEKTVNELCDVCGKSYQVVYEHKGIYLCYHCIKKLLKRGVE